MAASRLPRGLGIARNDNPFTSLLASARHSSGGEETSRVRSYVEEDLKEAFARDARDAGERPGVYLARALRARREGGRSRRVEAKLGRVLDDAEGLLSEIDPEGDGIPLTERRAIAICGRLGIQFTWEDLDEAIAAVAGDSPPTLRAYRERVLDRLDHAPHPANADLLVPEDRAREIASETDSPAIDAPAIDRKDYPDLSREEKGRGLRIAVVREATRNHGRYRFDAEAVRRDVFDGYPSERHVRGLMNLAANADGFEATRRQGKEWLLVDLRDVIDEEILSAVPNATVSVAVGGSRDGTSGMEAGKPGVEAELGTLDAANPVRSEGGGT